MCEMIWKNLEEKNMKLKERQNIFIAITVLMISLAVFALSLLFSMMISFGFKYVLVSTGYGILLSFVYALVWLYNRK